MKNKIFNLFTINALCISGSCSNHPAACIPEVDMQQDFAARRLGASGAWTKDEIETSWWTEFHDPVLCNLITLLMEENREIRIAWVRVCEARTETAIVSSEKMPQANFDLSGKKSTPGGGGYGGFGGGKNPFDVTQTQGSSLINASWEIDLFGHLEQLRRAAKAGEAITIEEAHGVHIAILADFTRAYFQYLAYQKLIDLVQEESALLSEKSKIVESKVKEGLAARVELDDITVQSQRNYENIPQYEAEKYASLFHMAYLLGMDAEHLSTRLKSAKVQARMPETVAAGLPCELLRRRPDIRKAEVEIEQAAAEEGVAIADLFPRLSLTGSLGYESLRFDDLSFSGLAWSYGSSLTAPIFDGGKRRANVERARYKNTEAYLQYEKAALQAIREADTALMRYSKAKEQEAYAKASFAARNSTFEQTYAKGKEGISARSQVIDAQLAKLDEERNYITRQIHTVDTLISLYSALGGGWDSPQ